MSHSLVQQGDNLRRQLAAQKSECAALRAECEMWKDRADEESRRVAMLEDQLKNSEKNKIRWRTRFQELLARGPSGSLDRKRKRTGHEDGRDDVSEGSRGSLARPSESVDDKYDPMAWADAQASINAVTSPGTPSDRPAKNEEEEVSALYLDPARGGSEYHDEDEVELLCDGAFPMTLGEIEINVMPRASSLPPDIVLARFRRANAHSLGIKIDPHFHEKAVTRRFLSSTYGGNRCTVQCQIAETTRQQKGHEISTYFCPNVRWSPYLPRAPGLPGLFNFPSAGLEIKEMPMFVGLDVGKWVYMGDYIGVPQEPLSKEEISRLGEEEWTAWVEDVGTLGWAKEIRARVYLRNKGIRPTDEAVKRLVEDRGPPQVSAEEIRAAYEQREEVMHVVCLKPIRYDAGFQQELIDSFQQFKTGKPRSRHRKEIEEDLNQSESPGEPRSRKKPRHHSPEV
ncbi:hypothetical protein FRC05_011067 [Tulasnella sp. 425]|nr:hypothetical protein FRC05_011067 [Tulasnella sp. 425]